MTSFETKSLVPTATPIIPISLRERFHAVMLRHQSLGLAMPPEAEELQQMIVDSENSGIYIVLFVYSTMLLVLLSLLDNIRHCLFLCVSYRLRLCVLDLGRSGLASNAGTTREARMFAVNKEVFFCIVMYC